MRPLALDAKDGHLVAVPEIGDAGRALAGGGTNIQRAALALEHHDGPAARGCFRLVRRFLSGFLGRLLGGSLRGSLGRLLRGSLGRLLRRFLGGLLRGGLSGLLRRDLGGLLRRDLGRLLRRSLGGPHLDCRQLERLGRVVRRQRATHCAEHDRQHDHARQNLSHCSLHDDILLAVHLRNNYMRLHVIPLYHKCTEIQDFGAFSSYFIPLQPAPHGKRTQRFLRLQ